MPKTPSVKELQETLRGAGLRSTAPRLAVLDYLHTHHGQHSHAELVEAIGDRGFDRATIYRILIDLYEAKLLSRTDLGDHVWRFGLVSDSGGAEHAEAHPHFVCTDCGQVSCLPGIVVNVTGGGKVPKSIVKNRVAIQLKGRCDKCA